MSEQNPIPSSTEQNQSAAAPPTSVRLLSLDALRGFNMFWIMGGDELLSAIAAKADQGWLNKVADIFCRHVEWEGFRYHDAIFPLFLFIIGVALPMAVAKRREKGDTQKQIVAKIVKRTLVMIALGFLYYGVLDLKGWENQRMVGVLQRLALGYGFAGLIMVYTSVRGQIIATVSLLVGYWLAMRFIPVPGYGAGNFSEWGNLANYIDRSILLKGQMYKEYGDPEGLFSTIPAVATALLGVLTGHWLRSNRDGNTKARGMLAAGVVCIAAGYLWSLDFPVIKKIWTSSYVLVAGGWSLLLLAAFYWTIDVKGWKRWTPFFVVIGVNPITIYVGSRFIDFDHTAEFFVKGLLKYCGDYRAIVAAAAGVAVRWLFLKFLDSHKIYFRA
jgi:predicted acyltransferase